MLFLRGRLGRRGRFTDGWAKSGGTRWPHRSLGVGRERLLAGVLHSDTNRARDGGAAPGGPWRFLVREWARLRRLMQLLRAVSVALLSLVLTVRYPACFSIALRIKNINPLDTVFQQLTVLVPDYSPRPGASATRSSHGR